MSTRGSGRNVAWLILTSALLTGWLIYLLAPVLTPFLAAALFAYLGDPLADRLEAWRLPRTLAVVVVFLGMGLALLLALLLLVPILENQISTLLHALPGYVAWIDAHALPWVQQRLGVDLHALNLQALPDLVAAHWRQAGGVAAHLFDTVSRSGLAVLGWLANLLLIPIVGFYLLRDWDRLVAYVHELLPLRYRDTVVLLTREADDRLGAFLRGQFSVMLALGTVYAVGLWLAGLKVGILIGILAGLVSFVPYLGFTLGIVAAAIAMFFQTHALISLWPIAVVFAVGQVLESAVFTPLLVGDRIGLHPVAVIFAVLAGGQLFGFVGILLALPCAAVLAVLLRHAHREYRGSRFFRRPRTDESDG
ncbi:AI-2E family transporter [Acidihalobacter aeolianus]|uniref:AI-2E family transporter n=1 Tax=Acidihalobacter aeolianus TaxID=2792603 RepID=A0A1D8K9B7_9GAMM|nr:AI-2E family transporter [Acidihalobacter aeolianus]AOV17532.1 AI-2E family transporter [Acidihalobacter aeolianus]